MGHVDRAALLRRHRPVVTSILPASPLAVGNGEFCFTVDVTGLQTFPEQYPLADRYGDAPGTLLATMAEWGWHTTPAGPDERGGLESTMRSYPTPRGPADYVDLGGVLDATTAHGQSPTEQWLRANPHRLDLGRLGLWLDGPVRPGDVSRAHQTLDLATGVITSRFRHGAHDVEVTTVADPALDAVAVCISTSAPGEHGVMLSFPGASGSWGNAADWTRPAAHTSLLAAADGGCTITRTLDDTRYLVRVAGENLAVRRTGDHVFVATSHSSSSGASTLIVEFSPDDAATQADHRTRPDRWRLDRLPDAAEVRERSIRSWTTFWNSGAAVAITNENDPDAATELERRVVLSQYLTRIHCAGSRPPAETGLTANSWRGRSHLEMHWWHAAHFAMWGRPEHLTRSLDWYKRILPRARETARRQGLAGARWPKQVGPSGEETPSDIGPFLLWQQPHPIHLAELVRRASSDGGREALERWAPLVFETAECMAALAVDAGRGFVLVPPLVPAQESYAADRLRVKNPAFELAYWRWALRVAEDWRRMLGLRPRHDWALVADGIVAPRIRHGVYTAIDGPPFTVRRDHPSMLGALGFVPDTGLIDAPTMERTLVDVLDDWDWPTAWGWDYPLAAMTAARVGRPDLATRALLMPTAKNGYLPNGHNWQDESLPLYLPGNGGVLAAVAMMAGGWDGESRAAPGFAPGWTVQSEGLVRLP